MVSKINENIIANKSKNSEIQEWKRNLTSTVGLFAGDRTGEDRSSTSSYWRMY
jgi:hypothetical protein